MKNLNEEIKRIKSLFDDGRLYGNLVTEAASGRYGWLDDLIRMLDNTHPKKLVSNKKWSKFSNRVKNANGFIDELRKSADFQNFIKTDIKDKIINQISSVLTDAKATAKLPDNFLANGVWNSIKKTLTENGIDISKSVSFKNQTQSVEKHLDEIWEISTHKTTLDSLQENIENLLSDRKVYSLDDASLDEVITKLKENFGEELNLLKSSDGNADVLDDVKNFVKKAAKNTDVKTAEQIAASVEVAKAKIIKAGQIKGQQAIEKAKSKATEWAQKYADWLNSEDRLARWLKNPLTGNHPLCKFLGWQRSFNKNTGDEIFSLYFKDGLAPIRIWVDLLGLYPGRVVHRILKQTNKKTIKSFNEMSTLYKISILSGSIAAQDGLLWHLFDLTRHIIKTLSDRNIFPNYFTGQIMKQSRLIWNVGLNECYEKKYEDGIFSVDANGEAYDDGEGLLWDDKEFNLMEIVKVDGMTKGEYKDYIKSERKRNGDETWLPSNFCKNFVCEGSGTPIKVPCGRYGGVGDENTKQEYLDTMEEAQKVIQGVVEVVEENASLKGYETFSDSSNVFKNKFENLNVKDIFDELIEKGDSTGVKELLEIMNGNLKLNKEFTDSVKEELNTELTDDQIQDYMDNFMSGGN